MSKGDDPTRDILAEILEALREGKESKYGSETSHTEVASRMEAQHNIQWLERATDKAVKQLIKVHEQYLRSLGVEFKKGFKGGNLDQVEKTLIKFVNNYQVSNEKAFSAVNTYFNRIIADANNKERIGKGNLKNVYGTENKELKTIIAEMRKSAGTVGTIDSTMSKVMDFFTGPSGLKKTLKTLGTDLIDGLEKSKWVGGALRDTFKLVGLLGANWLSQFGQLGRILGGAFYVAMETAGPLLVKMLLQGIGNILLGLPKVFGAMGWGRIAGAAIGTAGAAWAFNEAGDSWKKGRKGNAVTFGVGGATMGAGALAAAGALGATGLATVAGALGATGLAGTLGGIAAALSPVIAPLLLIGAAIAGIAALWKHFGPAAQKYFKDREEDSEKSNSFMDWLRDILPWGKDSHDGSSGTEIPTKDSFGHRVRNVIGARAQGRLKVAPDGSVLNATDFTQAELKAEMEAYQRANSDQFGRLYEVVSSKYASMGSFKTDAIMTDQKSGVTGALMYAGASEDMERIRALAKSRGMSEEQVAKILYTGGWSTGKGPHKSGLSVASSIGHDNPYALAYDIGLKGFSKKEQEIILWASQLAAKERAEKWGGAGAKVQDVYHEVTKGGQHVISKEYQEGPNQHIHAQLFKGYALPEGARLNEIDRKVVARNAAADIGSVLKWADKDEYERVSKQVEGKSEDYKAEYYKAALEKIGIEQDKVLKGNQFKRLNKETGLYEYINQDYQGNFQWLQVSGLMTGLENKGASGIW